MTGTGANNSTGDNGPAIAATLYTPISLFVDSNADIFVIEANSYRLRKVDMQTGEFVYISNMCAIDVCE